jgi:hypothetical protein
MKKKRSSKRRSRLLALVRVFGALGIVALLVTALAACGGTPTATPLNLPNSSGTAKSSANTETITAGDSKADCITVKFYYGILKQSAINAVSSLTGVTYNCIEGFANPSATWAVWEAPWMFSDTADGWDAWLAANPAHQVVLGLDLIPQSASGTDPLTWEQACDAGSYNHYATTLAKNLVSYGAGKIVIRLGPEGNGDWEADFLGTDQTEANDWAKCYDNEVTAMRAVPGAHFLFVWNPNACSEDAPLNEWYPGNSYVDIIGVDAYDMDCATSETVSQEGWAAFSTNRSAGGSNDPEFPSITNIAAFAKAHGKPMSFPEWGLDTGQPDDPTYVADMAKMFKSGDFAFESYFDDGADGIATLGSSIPNATAAYSQAFK